MNASCKGSGPKAASYAQGGPVLQTSSSRFFKTPDTFRTNIERSDYGKSSPGGELAKTSGDKSLKVIKPQK